MISVRLSKDLEVKLEQIAEQKKLTKSEIVKTRYFYTLNNILTRKLLMNLEKIYSVNMAAVRKIYHLIIRIF